jgi:hypothetical protein
MKMFTSLSMFQKQSSVKIGRLIAISILGACLPLNLYAAIPNALLSVDLQPIASQTETGFVAWDPSITPSTNYTTFAGNFTLSVSGEDQTFNRGLPSDSGAFTYGELYRDFLYNNNGSTASFTISGSGIKPNTPYEIIWYAYDISEAGATTVQFRPTPSSSTSGSIGQVVIPANPAAPTSDFQYSFAGIWTTTGTSLQIDAAATSGQFIRINGFEIIPELSSVALLAVGGLSLRLRQRGRA